jgi:long-chain acyl-CoA synthetase
MLQNARPCGLEPPKNAPDDVAVLLYTSGTTQEPRGVMQTHRNILSNIDASLRAMNVKDDDVFLGVLPLFHTFGLTCAFLLPVLSGRMVVMMQRFVPAAVAETVGRSGISIVIAVPSMYRAMVRAFAETGARPERLRLCISGGEALPTALLEEFEKVTGVPLLEGYGMTETSPVISLNLLHSPRPGTVGRPLDNFEVRIVDADGLPLPLGSEGEICVRGDSVMKGYWRRDEETGEAIDEDGWLRTGDLGKLDAEGNIAITGRLKELIISAGKNIAPAEIETVLQAHPAVSEAAVIGVPDAMRGEVPMAFVVRQTGSDLEVHELMSHCRAHLADYKRPRAIEFVETLPRSLTGKVLKRLLKRDIGVRQNDENAEVS